MKQAERVVLVGCMGAGKSTVGAELARRLGWTFLDLDCEIERREGRAIAEIFRVDGEARFRALEIEATGKLGGRSGLVLAVGGGWITQQGIAEQLGPGTMIVWLQVAPRTVVERLGSGDTGRPLLDGKDLLPTIEQLLIARTPAYAAADAAVVTDRRTVPEIAAAVEKIVRDHSIVNEG